MKIKRNMIIAIILITFGIFVYFKFVKTNPNIKFETTKIKIGTDIYSMEIAKSTSQLSLGLGNRQILCPKCGMIFIFPFEGILPFWMKDTQIPLDMIWINTNNKIVSIQTAPVETNKSNLQLQIYKNDQPARYVIELNAEIAKKINLKIGDIITIPSL